MANNNSQKKRNRQNIKRNLANKSVKSQLKTAINEAEDAISSNAENKNGFWLDDKNMPLKPETLVRQVNKTFKMIGLPKMNFKILREWTTQKFAEAGADIRSLQNMRQIKGIRRLKSLYKNDFGNLQDRFNVTHKRNKKTQ